MDKPWDQLASVIFVIFVIKSISHEFMHVSQDWSCCFGLRGFIFLRSSFVKRVIVTYYWFSASLSLLQYNDWYANLGEKKYSLKVKMVAPEELSKMLFFSGRFLLFLRNIYIVVIIGILLQRSTGMFLKYK